MLAEFSSDRTTAPERVTADLHPRLRGKNDGSRLALRTDAIIPSYVLIVQVEPSPTGEVDDTGTGAQDWTPYPSGGPCCWSPSVSSPSYRKGGDDSPMVRRHLGSVAEVIDR